jgi:hypothetical protein
MNRLPEPPKIQITMPRGVTEIDPFRHSRISRHDIGRQLREAPSLYLYYASLYAKVSEMVDRLSDKIQHLEAELSVKYSKKSEGVRRSRVKDIKALIYCNSEYMELQKVLRRWRDAERMFKYIEKTFDKRTETLRSLNANDRREKTESDYSE